MHDELLSSYLYRLSDVNVSKVHTFCKKYFTDQQVWNRDIDRSAPRSMLTKLSKITEVEYEIIFKTTLREYDGSLFESLNINGNNKWIMPLGIYHRKRKRFGIQFCPNCLIKDEAHPYFRKIWRLSLSVVCVRCGINLYDRCPFCLNVIAFHRNELGAKNFGISLPICCCSFCKRDFRTAVQIACQPDELSMQKKIIKWIVHGFTEHQNYSHTYFDVLYQLIKLLLSKTWQTEKFQQYMCTQQGIGWTKATSKSSFDLSDLTLRREVIKNGFWLLEDWPKRFISVCLNSELNSTTILKDFENAPFWFHSIVIDNFYRPNPLKSRGEIR